MSIYAGWPWLVFNCMLSSFYQLPDFPHLSLKEVQSGDLNLNLDMDCVWYPEDIRSFNK